VSNALAELRAERDDWEKAYAEAMRRGDRLRSAHESMKAEIQKHCDDYREGTNIRFESIRRILSRDA
jgi:hypothetical protein